MLMFQSRANTSFHTPTLISDHRLQGFDLDVVSTPEGDAECRNVTAAFASYMAFGEPTALQVPTARQSPTRLTSLPMTMTAPSTRTGAWDAPTQLQ
jgi:hypothetical protein